MGIERERDRYTHMRNVVARTYKRILNSTSLEEVERAGRTRAPRLVVIIVTVIMNS